MKAGSPDWWQRPTDAAFQKQCRHVSTSTDAGFPIQGMDAAALFAPPPMLPGTSAARNPATAQPGGRLFAAAWFDSSGVLRSAVRRRPKTRGRLA